MSLNTIKTSKIAINLLIDELKIDLGGRSFKNDRTTNKLIVKKKDVKFYIVPREKIVLCGILFIKKFIKKQFKKISIKVSYKDGDIIKPGEKIAVLSGDCKKILSVERTILNFLQHLSAISTTTYKLNQKIINKRTKLLDTRKTTIGLRHLEKYATRMGGATNHRHSLNEKILIKDNHIKALGGIENIIKIILKENLKSFQIECDSISQVKRLMKIGCNDFLLDNMKVSEVKKCLKLKKNKNILFEISGGINNKNIVQYSRLGADYISAGFITQNPDAVDIGLDIF
ncbi:MAG: nicotinate-nucleotide diphosphorylase (carboxylating) [Rickettsiales bacterium]|nr:nicotinate-nucleotide diphosphorylase (carboxylating) [Rickettsiales bacterium]